MTKAAQTKGILPDGKKIRELRERVGKTQKGLIQGSGIELRTYQRAEQGRPILPEWLQRISVLLNTDLKELRIEKDHAPNAKELFRLQCISENGANKLLNELQSLFGKVEYRFEINPTTKDAEQVAALVEYCQELVISNCDEEDKILEPASKIRAIGRLNDMLTSLASKKIYVFTGEYQLWGVQIVKVRTPEPDGLVIKASFPNLSTKLRIVMKNDAAPHINETYSPWRSTRENAYQQAIAANLEAGILPDWLECAVREALFWYGFIAEYRREYDRRKTQQNSPLQLAGPAEP